MARKCLSNKESFSGANVITIEKRRPKRKKLVFQTALPHVGDNIIYNVKNSFGDKRMRNQKKEQRGCIKVTGIFPAFVTGISYKMISVTGEIIGEKITISKTDFSIGNVLFVKINKLVYSNNYEYDDYQLINADTVEKMVERLHPYLKEICNKEEKGNEYAKVVNDNPAKR